jgi:hypothetical protein
MAVIEKRAVESSSGIKKGIDENSTNLALDILQRGLYAFPIQSTIRELASNAYDAVKERDVAKSILGGKTIVAEHFDLTKDEDGIYTDSGWDSDYFDLNWLSDDPNVYVFYEEGKQRDTLRIVDNGVGLGKNRLVGYFQLNYSTKRKNKDALGKWGLGSKVALALGVDSFRVTTRYNGKKFRFDVYLDKVESVTPKFGSKGENEEVILKEKSDTQDSYIAYCETTEEMNGLELVVEVKKHNRQKFFDAIKSQLMYMPNIKVLHKKAGHMTHEPVDIAAKVLYRDDDIILSESTMYNKPHILLGTGKALINYGFVAFNELDIEPKGGSVGLILNINDIEVTPSREAPVWSSKTRAAVLKKYNDVTATATKLVESQLKEADYVKWLGKAASTLHALKYGNTGSSDSVVARLASIIDVSSISSVRYSGNRLISYSSDPSEMLGDFITAWEIKYNSREGKIERKKVKDLALLNKPVYLVRSSANGIVDRYLYEEHGSFIHIRIKEGAGKDRYVKHVLESDLLEYDTVTVPQDRLNLYESEDLVEEEDSVVTANVVAKNRKLNNEIVVHMVKEGGAARGKFYSFAQRTKKITELFSLNTGNLVIYSLYGDRSSLHEVLEMLPSCYLNCGSYGFSEAPYKYNFIEDNRKIEAIMVASENSKYLKGSSMFTALEDFIVQDYNAETGKLVFSKHMKLAASFAFISEIVKERFKDEVSNMYRDSFKLINEEDFTILKSFMAPWGADSSGPKKMVTKQPWYRDCVSYSASCLGLIDSSEDTKEQLLIDIDDNIPDILCERITDEVKGIDLLDADLITKVLGLIEYYAPISLFVKTIGSYYYTVDEDKKLFSAKQLGILCKTLNENPDAVDTWNFPNFLGEVKDDE